MKGIFGALTKLSPRQQRAQDQGFDLSSPYFHASKQDIDEMKPGYDDGLVFVTPDPEFANNWLGKGKFQERQGGTGSIEELKKQKTILRAEHNKVMKSLSEADRQLYYDEVAWPQSRQLITEIDQADRAIYPLLSKTKKPFRPDQDYKVFEELYDKQRLDSGFSPADGLPTFRDALKDGNYLLYENKEVVDFLKSKGYDSMFLKENSGSGEKFSTLAVFDGQDLRSTNAQFDPSKTESRNILASGAPVAAGILGAGAALSPEEAEAVFLPGRIIANTARGLLDEVNPKATPENYEKAQQMLAEGRAPYRVWEETGMFRGADGNLRFEVSDDQSKFKVDPNAEVGATTNSLSPPYSQPLSRPVSTVFEHPAIRADMMGGKDRVSFVRKEDIGGANANYNPGTGDVSLAIDRPPSSDGVFFPSKTSPKSSLLHELQHSIQEESGFSSGANTGSVRTQILKNLIENPQIAEKRIMNNSNYNILTDMGRSVSKIVNFLELQKYSKDSNLTGKRRLLMGRSDWYEHGDDIRSKLGPEPKKHRPKSERELWLSQAWSELSNRARKEIGPSDLNNANRVITSSRGKIVNEGFPTGESILSRDNSDVNLTKEFWDKFSLQDLKNAEKRIYNQREKFFDSHKETQGKKNILDLVNNSEDFDLYKRTAGETEARNVQTRMNMTPEERENSYPPLTEDIARENQIIVENPLEEPQRGSIDPRLLGGIAAGSAAAPTLAAQGAGIMDFLANAAQGAIAPIANAPNTIIQALTSDRSNEQLKADRDQRLDQNDYQLRTDLGQQYTQNAQQTIGGLLQALASQPEIKNIIEALGVGGGILQTAPEAYNQVPERGRIVTESLLDAVL